MKLTSQNSKPLSIYVNKRHNNFYSAKGKILSNSTRVHQEKGKEKRPLRSHPRQWSKRPNGKEQNKLEKKNKQTKGDNINHLAKFKILIKIKKNSKKYANRVDSKFRVGSRAPNPTLNLRG